MNSKAAYQSYVVKFFYFVACTLLVLIAMASTIAQNQTGKVKMVKAHSVDAKQPIYSEYRGVRLNMTMEEVRNKLGAAVMRSDEMDMYVFSADETAQIAYNTEHKVVTISTDYTGGVGAPDYKSVVGLGLLERPDGSLYRMVQYESEGFWVSYNKSAGIVPVVTITLQVLPK